MQWSTLVTLGLRVVGDFGGEGGLVVSPEECNKIRKNTKNQDDTDDAQDNGINAESKNQHCDANSDQNGPRMSCP